MGHRVSPGQCAHRKQSRARQRPSFQAPNASIKIQEKSGAGGGNRTIRAYSFYVTYCKHTNARTAQPAVCPPPMYKIMYNEIGRCGVAHRLRCYEDYCTCTLASSALLSAVSLARAQFSGKRAQTLFAGMTASIASLSDTQFRWKKEDCLLSNVSS